MMTTRQACDVSDPGLAPGWKKDRMIARNAVWNLAGQALPLLVAFFAIPMLIDGLGKDRFGILTLAWLVVGYFGLFDLGLGRALTIVVAERLGSGQKQELPSLVWTSLALMAFLGLLASAIAGLLTPWLVHQVIRIPASLRHEGTQAFALLAVSLPFVVTSSGLRGILEAYQRFGPLNLVGVVMGSFTYIGPVLALCLSHTLLPPIVILLASRIAMCMVYLVFCISAMPSLRRGFAFDRSHVAALLRLGGWMTVSNVVSPLMVSLDRFLIGSMVSVGAITYYTVPYEVVTKLWIIPYSLVRVLFPAFAATSADDRRRLDSLFDRGVDAISLIMLPIVVVTVVLAGDMLTCWLGGEFSRNGTRVMQWLVLGVFLNSLAMIPSTLLQALGRPDLTAKLHLVELPVFLLMLWSMIHMFGIEGAAIAWMLRVGFDALLLFAVARRLLPSGASRVHSSGLLVGVLLPLLIIVALQFAVIPKWVIMSIAFIACGFVCRRRMLRGRSLIGGSIGAIGAEC